MRISEACTSLRLLDLSRYRPKSRDLTGLPALAVEDLTLVQSPLRTIDGIERFTGLRRLELSYLTRLERIGAVAGLAGGRLERLECLKCRKIRDHAAVRAADSLKVLRFNACGDIPSIAFLNEMPNLEEFRFVHTNVLDGDLTPLLRLKAAGFFAKKHYSHKPEEVAAIIGQEGP
jgi:hypothetical protein